MPTRAVALVDEGNKLEEQGRLDEAMACYEHAVQTDPSCARAHLNRGNILLASGQTDAARRAYQLAIDCDPQYASAHFNLGNLHYGVGERDLALQNYRDAIRIKPDFAQGFVALGNALDALGRTAEALASYERALAIEPGHPGIHFNLGLLAAAAGRYEQAAASLRRAIEIQPDYAAAHHALGGVCSSVGDLDAAEASLRQALAIQPNADEILHDLSLVLSACGRSPEAVELLMRRLECAPSGKIKTAFARCVACTSFRTSDARIRAALAVAIEEPWGAPFQLCRRALELLMLDSRIGSLVRRINETWPQRPTAADAFGADDLTSLATEPLLLAVLRAAPVSSIAFERFLTAVRRGLLDAARVQLPDHPGSVTAFYAALAQQCFINEYIFDCDASEQAAAAACRQQLIELLDKGEAVPALLLLTVAAYFPLHDVPQPARLLATHQEPPIAEVLRQQISEPLAERELRGGVECLTSISAGVSAKVRDQYEQNPYPRWMKLPTTPPELNFNAELRRTLPLARFIPLPDDSQPEMLIAGCGTGSQPLMAAQRIRGVRILAIDLSLNSISYAKRKTQESGFTNIAYAQADILQLGCSDRTFDIVAAVGVLHHLADPFEGWRILLSRVRPGGFMHLGFYSRLARKHVAKARELVAARGYAATIDGIRRVRRDLQAMEGSEELQWLSAVPDFYSTSDCRDLLFHVQEHCLTLDQIDRLLSDAGLDFLGFDLDARILHQYRARFGDDPAGTDLAKWATFEVDHPDTFSGMYQFWVQKPTL